MADMSVIFFYFLRRTYIKKPVNKIKPESLGKIECTYMEHLFTAMPF